MPLSCYVRCNARKPGNALRCVSRCRRPLQRMSLSRVCVFSARRLNARAEDVLAGTVARTRASKHRSTPPSRKASSVSAWLRRRLWRAGWRGRAWRRLARSGMETWHIFGQLAADRVAPLQEVLKRCLRWRDAAADVLHREREELGVPRGRACLLALAALQRTLDITLIQVGEFFETERHTRGRGARVPGDTRPADRSAEPDVDPGSRRADARALASQPDAGRGAVRRSRQLQVDQRHARSRRRRRTAASSRREAGRRRAGHRRAGAPRWG